MCIMNAKSKKKIIMDKQICKTQNELGTIVTAGALFPQNDHPKKT